MSKTRQHFPDPKRYFQSLQKVPTLEHDRKRQLRSVKFFQPQFSVYTTEHKNTPFTYSSALNLRESLWSPKPSELQRPTRRAGTVKMFPTEQELAVHT